MTRLRWRDLISVQTTENEYTNFLRKCITYGIFHVMISEPTWQKPNCLTPKAGRIIEMFMVFGGYLSSFQQENL